MSRVIPLLAAAAVLAAATPMAAAQAWVGEKGVLGVGATYQLDQSDKVVEVGVNDEDGFVGTNALMQTLMLDASYTPIDKLGLRVFVPVMFGRYTGETDLFPPHGEWDDGKTHAALQDFRLDARYQLLSSPLVVTPLLGVSVPMSDYPIQGFAVPGRGLKKAHMGLSIARLLDPILPNLYLHGSYEFSLVETLDEHPDHEEFSQHHSLMGFEAGYFITERLSASLGFNYLLFHDGIKFIDYGDYSGPVKDYHDALLKEEVMLVSLGAGYALTDSMHLSFFGRLFVSGDNTRETRQVGLALSWDIPVAAEPIEVEAEAEAEADGEIAGR